MPKYRIHFRAFGEDVLCPVSADPLVIPGFEEFTFITHRARVLRGPRLHTLPGYTVTELSTGMALTRPMPRQAAIDSATKKLRAIGPAKFRELVHNALLT